MKKFLMFVFGAGMLAGCQHMHDGKPCDYYRENAETPIYFRFDSSEITEKSKETLDTGIVFFKLHRFKQIQLDGYADETGGDSEYNTDLSRRRAEFVRDYMIDKGILAKRIDVKWHGAEKGAPKKEHRRVDVTIK